MTKCAILGASGHGKVVAEIAELNGYTEIDFFDDRFPELIAIEHWKVKGASKELFETCQHYEQVVIAIGNNEIRAQKFMELKVAGAKMNPLVHPKSVVSKYTKIGDGTVIMAGATINPFSSIGEACIINTNASIDHDCVIDNGAHISPGASLAGAVQVGSNSWIGIGASVKQLTVIGCNTIIGAGSTVVSNIESNLVVIGTPAKPI